MQNNLFLKRLVIYTNSGMVAYDELFHKGVNIICGDNSSGKSTITHFIFFALGGEFNDFVPEARECQVVYAEIEADGANNHTHNNHRVEANQSAFKEIAKGHFPPAVVVGISDNKTRKDEEKIDCQVAVIHDLFQVATS